MSAWTVLAALAVMAVVLGIFYFCVLYVALRVMAYFGLAFRRPDSREGSED